MSGCVQSRNVTLVRSGTPISPDLSAWSGLQDQIGAGEGHPSAIQTRVIEATKSLLAITIDEFANDLELTIKFTRLLDLIAVDREDVEFIAVETAPYLSDDQASIIADLVCDFLYEIA
ncbi:UNVERIFIED_ORG: hypothetical protein GGE44_001057 [Rhizobium esperanzae]